VESIDYQNFEPKQNKTMKLICLYRDWMDPGLVGLALSNALTVTNAMSYLVS
jgi:hypothetical protein